MNIHTVRSWLAGCAMWVAVPVAVAQQGIDTSVTHATNPFAVPQSMTLGLSAESPRIPIGAPIRLELVITTSGSWDCVIGNPIWQHQSADSTEWLPLDLKEADVPIDVHIDDTTTFRVRSSIGTIYRLFPGRWRAKVELSVGVKAFSTDWCYVEVAEHAVNRQIMTGKRGSDLQHAWEWVMNEGELGEELAVPAGGMGSTTPHDVMERNAQSLRGLRSAGASVELSAGGEMIVLQREVRRLHRMQDEISRMQAAAKVHQDIERLIGETVQLATPLGGRRGELLELDAALWKPIDPRRTQRIREEVQDAYPLLAARIR